MPAVFMCWPVKGRGDITSVRMDRSVAGGEKDALVLVLGLLTKNLKPLVEVRLAKISPDFLSVDDASKKSIF